MRIQTELNRRFAAVITIGTLLLVSCASDSKWKAAPDSELLAQPASTDLSSTHPGSSEPLRFIPWEMAGLEPTYQVMGPTGAFLFHRHGYSLGLHRGRGPDLYAPDSVPLIPVHLAFEGSNPNATLRAERQLPGTINIFQGSDATKWREAVPAFGVLHYSELYDGVDLLLEGKASALGAGLELKGTFEVRAGADPGQIRWRYDGAAALELSPTGDLVILVETGEAMADATSRLIERAPVAWQNIGEHQVSVDVRYQIDSDGAVSFAVADYRPDYPLVIDPTLEYSTFLGGSGVDELFDIVVDPARSTVLVGASISVDYPTDNPISDDLVGSRNVIVSKLSRNGNVLEFSTFIGGGSDDVARSVAVDAGGDIYILGQTFSEDFPATREPQAPEDGGGNLFLTKLSLSGSSIRYSIILGGSEDDDGLAVAADAAGNAYLAGMTESTDLPTINALQSSFGGGESDGFIARLNAVGSEFAYITYLGGTGAESVSALAIDRRSNVYVTGFTDSIDFPLLRPVQEELQGDQDAFVVKILEDGTTLDYSTYLGAGDRSRGDDIAVDRDNNVYIAGTIESAQGDTADRGADIFVAKLNEDGSGVDFITEFGGTGDDEAFGIGIDRDRNIFVTGVTESEDLQHDALIQPAYGGNGDAYVAQLTAGGSLVTQNYIGGSDFDQGNSISVFGSGDAVVAGVTFSPDFPTLNPLQSTNRGDGDAFVLLIEDVEVVPTPVPTDTPEPTPLPPPPTPEPTAFEAIVDSNEFLYGIFGLIGLVILLLIFEMIRGSRRRRKRNKPPDLF